MKIFDALAPLVKIITEQVMTVLFRKLVAREPEHGKVLLTSLYPVVDVELEGIFDSTPNELDDAAVDGLKAAMETVAKEVGITLPNLDQD